MPRLRFLLVFCTFFLHEPRLNIAMIEELYISNVALIDELQLECSSGLNIFTGETGAGKSVILNAVGLALGERSTSGIVRDGATNAKIQIAVALPPGSSRVG